MVECYSGTRYGERPTAIAVGGRRLAVERVLRSWRSPVGPGFDVEVVDGRRFRLQLDEGTDRWHIAELDR